MIPRAWHPETSMRHDYNPFGTDAQTVRYAAEQVKLPALTAQLRRIADDLERKGVQRA